MPRYYYDIFAPCLKKPIQKTSSLEPPEQTHFKKNIIGAIGPNPFKKIREMREQIESKNERENGEQR